MVLPNDNIFAESLLFNNGVTQWRRFRGTLGFFFEWLRAKSGTGLRIDKHRFFLALSSTVLCHSALFCVACFGAALRGATLRGWWKHAIEMWEYLFFCCQTFQVGSLILGMNHKISIIHRLDARVRSNPDQIVVNLRLN